MSLVIINKQKPVYLDRKMKKVRLGNLPSTGKEIQNAEEIIFDILSMATKTISRKTLVDRIIEYHKVDRKNVDELIEDLLYNEFLIKYEDYRNIMDFDNNRYILFLSMFTGIEIAKEKYDYMVNKTIALVGLGSIGSNVLLILIKCGFKKFIFIDSDIVEKENLDRQIIYTKMDINKYKVDAAYYNSLIINPNLDIIRHNLFIEDENTLENCIQGCDFIISSVDKPYRLIRNIVNEASVKTKIPVLFLGFSEYLGMVGPLIIPGETACHKCINKNLGDNLVAEIGNVESTPSFLPICFVVANFGVFEMIKYLANLDVSNIQGKTLLIDMVNLRMNATVWNKDSECEICMNK